MGSGQRGLSRYPSPEHMCEHRPALPSTASALQSFVFLTYSFQRSRLRSRIPQSHESVPLNRYNHRAKRSLWLHWDFSLSRRIWCCLAADGRDRPEPCPQAHPPGPFPGTRTAARTARHTAAQQGPAAVRAAVTGQSRPPVRSARSPRPYPAGSPPEGSVATWPAGGGARTDRAAPRTARPPAAPPRDVSAAPPAHWPLWRGGAGGARAPSAAPGPP